MAEFKLGNKTIGDYHPVYFIADLSANHDGSLARAKELCKLAKDAGADCAKMQHFRAEKIVSKYGFEQVGKLSHQAGWKEDVYAAFQRLSVPWGWTLALKQYCDEIGIEFMSTPYDIETVDHLDPYVSAYKIGSGDITYHQLIEHIVEKCKPILMSCGASDMDDVIAAMNLTGFPVCLMQCNTNYTAYEDNFKYINLRVLEEFADEWPNIVLGLSDHTTTYTTVLGAVALGARVIEKHFTDNPARTGPDHAFSITPREWYDMVEATRELEDALGDGNKKVEANEQETVILQRRCLRASRILDRDSVISADMVDILRPCPIDGFPPYMLDTIIGKTLIKDMVEGEHFTNKHFVA